MVLSDGNAELPSWADRQLSADLPRLRVAGEGQALEYMKQFPDQAHELAKEIAAFATSNQGVILIGVGNDGSLIGLQDADTMLGRDRWMQRVQGICNGPVKPRVNANVAFAVESGKTVMVITVPRGNRPLYYSRNIPYLRNVTESRPAEPDEVIDLIRAWMEAGKPDPFSAMVSRIANILIDVLIDGDEIEERMISPWTDQWRWNFRYAADELRDIASQNLAVERGVAADLTALAHALDDAGTTESRLGNGPDIRAVVGKAMEAAASIKERWVDSASLSEESLSEVRTEVSSTTRQLNELAQRAEKMADQGRIEELTSKAAAIAMILLRMSYYKIDALSPALSPKLRNIGRRLHLLETKRIYADGGQSMQKIVDVINETANELTRIALLTNP